jgi:hypothetical protein
MFLRRQRYFGRRHLDIKRLQSDVIVFHLIFFYLLFSEVTVFYFILFCLIFSTHLVQKEAPKRSYCIVFYLILSYLNFSAHLVHKEAPKRVGRVYSRKGIVVSAKTGAHSQKVSALVYALYKSLCPSVGTLYKSQCRRTV